MGIELAEHYLLLNELIESLTWYKKYILDEFEIGEGQKENFMIRNSDVFNAISDVVLAIDGIKKAKESGDYSFTNHEMQIKTLKALFVARFSRMIT
jgi:hypothetical protein